MAIKTKIYINLHRSIKIDLEHFIAKVIFHLISKKVYIPFIKSIGVIWKLILNTTLFLYVVINIIRYIFTTFEMFLFLCNHLYAAMKNS